MKELGSCSCNLDQRARVLSRDEQERSSGARRCSPALLPLLQRADRDPEQLSESRLREPSPFPDGRDRRHCGNPAVFAPLELTKPL